MARVSGDLSPLLDIHRVPVFNDADASQFIRFTESLVAPCSHDLNSTRFVPPSEFQQIRTEFELERILSCRRYLAQEHRDRRDSRDWKSGGGESNKEPMAGVLRVAKNTFDSTLVAHFTL